MGEIDEIVRAWRRILGVSLDPARVGRNLAEIRKHSEVRYGRNDNDDGGQDGGVSVLPEGGGKDEGGAEKVQRPGGGDPFGLKGAGATGKGPRPKTRRTKG